MAVINGTQFDDTIHMKADGVTHAGNGTEFATATNATDTIDAGAGSDRIYARDGADSIIAGLGNDYIEAGGGADTVDGGEGNDTIFGGQGADILTGDIGNDVFYYIGVSEVSGLAETIDGGNDVDTMDFQTLGAVGTFDLSKATITSVENLFVSNNLITLTAAQLSSFDLISAGGAFERFTLSAAGTVDLTGASVINIDEFRGTSGADTYIFSGVATGQTINTLGGVDKVTGSEGNDVINTGDDADTVNAGTGDDTIFGGSGVDTLRGEIGNDTVVGGSGADILSGSIGNDIFRFAFVEDVSGLAEIINGSNDTDRLDFATLGAAGAVDLTKAVITSVEELQLNANDVTLTAAQLGAFTSIFAGGATERLILSAAGTADLTGASIVNIDEFRGSSGDDVINITDVTNGQFIDGRGGSDTLTGGFGADSLWGDTGADTIDGGDGSDLIRGGQNTDVLKGGVGNDIFQIQQISDISGLAETIDGGNDVDRIDFTASNAFGIVDLTKAVISNVEVLSLNDNVVTLTANQLGAFETINAGGNVERLIISAPGTANLTGAIISGIDEIRGSSGDDSIILTNVSNGQFASGQEGADTLLGGLGNDFFEGGDGNDLIQGRAGIDTLTGGSGGDSLRGDVGNDIFLYHLVTDSLNATGKFDRVADFEHGLDVFDLRAIDANINVAGDQAFSFVGAAAFKGVAGELRYDGTSIVGDVDGNKSIDFRIDVTGSPTITASDFLL